jgi:hypothetical protein
LNEGSCVHSGQPQIELAELKRRLAAIPSSAPMVRRLLQSKVRNLENEIRAKQSVEPLKSNELPHNKKIQTQVAGRRVDQKDSPRWRQFNRPPPTAEEAAARRRLNQVAQSIARRTGLPVGDSGAKVGPEGDADCDMAAETASAPAIDSTQAAEPTKERSKFDAKLSEEARKYIRDSLKNTERKAMFFLALLTTMLVFVITHTARSRWLADGVQWSFEDMLGMLSMLGLAVAAAFMLSVLNLGLKDSNGVMRFLDAMTGPDEPVKSAHGPEGRHFDHLTQVLQEDFYELTGRYDAASRILRHGFWLGSIAGFLSLLFLLLSRTEHVQTFAPGKLRF